MLDNYTQKAIRPLISSLAGALHGLGVGANTLTWWGWGLGMASAVAIVNQMYVLGLCVLLLSRLCDGLDGAVARLSQPSDAGGFLDISLDFWFYAAIPLAFAWADPARNALAAACLLAAFISTGTSFLAYAVMREKQKAHTSQATYLQPQHEPNPTAPEATVTRGGLTEATETLGFFVAMCLWPSYFPTLAFVFSALCTVTSLTRIRSGLRDL
jgi:phosphatidylglycerophosphate synthase